MPIATSQEIQARMARALAAALGGSVRDGYRAIVVHDGVSLTISPFEGGEHADSCATISAELSLTSEPRENVYRSDGRPLIAGRPDLDLRARGANDILGEKLGLDSPLVADPAIFSRAVIVESAAPSEIVHGVLAAPSARAAVLELIQAGCQPVKIHVTKGTVSTTICAARSEELHEAVGRILPTFATLSAALPRFARQGRIWRGRTIDWLGPLLGFGLLVGGIVLVLLGMLNWEPQRHTAFRGGLYWGLPIWTVLVLPIFFLSRGRSGGLQTFSLTILPMLVGLPATIAGGAIVANAKLDNGSTTMRSVEIVRKVDGANSKHLLHLQSPWEGRSEVEVIEVTAEQYAAVRQGQHVRVRIRPGRFGWPWMDGWEH